MSKSVAAPQQSPAPEQAQSWLPTLNQDFLMTMVHTQGPLSPVTVGVAGLMGMAWVRDQMKEAMAPTPATTTSAGPTGRPLTPQEQYDLAKTPEEKLAAWRGLHRSKAEGALGDREETSWYDFSDANDAAEHRNALKEQTLQSTYAEVDDEIAALQAQHARDGTPLTMEEVDALAQRKEYELSVETQNGVNLTNTGGDTPDRRTWSLDELVSVGQTLAGTKEGALQNNPELREIRREARDADGSAQPGGYKDGVVSVYDSAYSVHVDERTGLTANGAPGGVEDALAQNLSLAAAAQNPEQYEQFTDSITKDGATARTTLPTETNDMGEDQWSAAKSSTKAAWMSLYTRRLFAGADTQQTMIDDPAASLQEQDTHLQARKEERLAARQQGADVTEMGILDRDIAFASGQVDAERDTLGRRQGVWDAINALF